MLTKRMPRARLGTLLLMLGLVVLGALALLPLRSPDPAGLDAPAGEFSAERARPHIERIATRPRPMGSAANAEVRAYLVEQLRALGLQPKVQQVTAADSYPDHASVAGRVSNVHATVPGTGGTGRVLIVAHYDSVFTGPGATDDGMGVATVLEVARALKSGPAPRNTVELLITDGEEPGSLGAKGFTDSALAGDPKNTVILNLEARGTKGRLVMFETGEGNAAFLSSLSDRTPFATSTSDEIYRLLPNDTDFTVFQKAGFTGMNFAVVAGSARYDMELDNLANQRLETLQDMGSTVLAATRKLSGGDLSVPEAGDSTYFTVFGLLVSYPQGLGTALAVLGSAAAAVLIWFARRRGAVRVRGVALVAGTLPLPLVGSVALGFLGWQVLVVLRPHYDAFQFGDPYRPGPAITGLIVLTAVACLFWLLWMRRRRDAFTVGAGVLCWFAGLALLTAFLLPGASYLFLWPTLIGVLGLAVALRLADESPWQPVALSAAAVPSVVLLLPLTAVLFPTLGLAFSGAALAVVVLLLLPALPGLLPLPRRRLVPVALAAGALLGGALVGVGAAADGVDAHHPAQAGLFYVHDADTGADSWYSDADSGEPWVRQHAPGPKTSVEERIPALIQPGGYRKGPASGGTTPVPQAKVLQQRRSGDIREVRLRLSADRATATALSFYADARRTQLVDVTVDGKRLPGGRNRQTSTPWKWGCHLVAPAGGFEVVLRLRGDSPVPLRLLAYAAEVPASALKSPRPATIAWTPSGFGQGIGIRTINV
ncbi:M20/M25/M40 family metallo-hydrolase [Streptomyces sp. NBC_01142]|uniref:M20/M25/M40 family metallo-hydrolase n=1 Tax=Streptomyces sp. NBC_01142 TaxID=2975865 RepID=UPI002254B0D2|nr:M20/M25/M40 family metallo-hydrolase [Streptomyces sp. NBC_01142]MCX4820786.1 M20/M25/M40 family metallo-hydrolase [Streptomyces sp. NBC_01142]